MMRPHPRRRGLYIALEGIDGVGKSTLQRRLARLWRARGYVVLCTREPVDRVLGRQAQQIARTDPWSSALLFTVDRLTARDRIERALRRGDIVLQDRSFYSTLAYQGSALPPKLARRLEALQLRLVHHPDRVVLLDLPPHHALRRVRRRRKELAPLEEALTLRRVLRSYRSYGRRLGWTIRRSDADPAQLALEIDRTLRPALRRLSAARRPGR